MKKVVTLSGALILIVLATDFIGVKDACSTYKCEVFLDGLLQSIFFLSLISLIFGSITTYLKRESFNKWWAFARYAIPVVFVLTFVINAGFHHDPGGQWQDMFDLPVILGLYLIFIIGSIIQLWRGYRETKNT